MDDDGSGAAGRRPYNRPRRYPTAPRVDVEPPVAPTSPGVGPDTAADPRPPAAPPPSPVEPPPMTAPPGPTRAQSTRGLLIGLAVLVVLGVVGLVIGLSRGGGATPGTARSAPAAPSPESAAEICTRLGATAPLATVVADPHPAARMPAGYLEPGTGTRLAVCVGTFRAGAGAGRGRLAYVAEYARLPATRYALTLKTSGWVPEPSLPGSTYGGPRHTTVTLIQQGTTLVTVVGTGG